MATALQISDLNPLLTSIVSGTKFGIDDPSRVTWYVTMAQLQTYVNANAQIAESQVTNLTTDLAARPTISGTPAATVLTGWNSGTAVQGTPINFDSSGNLTNVGTINGFSLANFLIKTNNLSDISNAATARSNLSVPAESTYAGNPNGNVAGVKVGDLCWDTLDNYLYVCSTAGTATTAVWKECLDLSPVMFRINNLSDVQNKTSAFNNVSPLTTAGDLIAFDGTNNVRLPGSLTNNYVLTYDSTQTTKMKWAAAPSPGTVVRTISTTTTLTSADFGSTILCEGNSSYTVTLPLASSGTNQFIYFVFDTGQQVFVNIVGQGSDYIIGPGPNNPNYLFGTGEYLQMMSDGTTWLPSAVLQPCDFTGGLTNSFSSTNSFQPVPFNLVSKNNMVYDAVTGYVTPIYPGRYRITVQMTAPQNASQYSQAVGVSVIGDKYYYAGNTPVTNASAINSITFTREFSFPGTGTAPGNGTFAPVYQSTLNLTLGGAGGDAINFMSIVRVSNY